MKRIIVISIIGLAIWVLAGIEQDEKRGGLYNNDRFISSEKSVIFCAATKGEEEISWLLKHANASVEIDLDEVKSLGLGEIKELILKYPLQGELNFTIGTDISSWETLGYKPVKHPCTDSGERLNFIYHVKSPYSKKSKDGLISLNMNDKKSDNLQKYLEEYSDIPVYGLLWESVSEREVDKGWAFRLRGMDFKTESVKANKGNKIDQIFKLASDIANDLKKFAMKVWNNPGKLVSDIANDLERLAKKAWDYVKIFF